MGISLIFPKAVGGPPYIYISYIKRFFIVIQEGFLRSNVVEIFTILTKKSEKNLPMGGPSGNQTFLQGCASLGQIFPDNPFGLSTVCTKSMWRTSEQPTPQSSRQVKSSWTVCWFGSLGKLKFDKESLNLCRPQFYVAVPHDKRLLAVNLAFCFNGREITVPTPRRTMLVSPLFRSHLGADRKNSRPQARPSSAIKGRPIRTCSFSSNTHRSLDKNLSLLAAQT